MSFAFMVAGFIAATNAGRVAQAARDQGAAARALAIAVAIGAALVVAATLLADPILDGLEISPESFRIAAGIVAVGTGLRWIVWPRFEGPLMAVLVTPELACLALSFGADESATRTLAAAAISVPVLAVAALVRPSDPGAIAARMLAGLQIVIGVALVVSGTRDV